MPGVLNFTLGLATNSALQKLTGFTGALAGLFGVGLSLNSVFKEISEGGRLFDLGKRTNETVKNLFGLEHAFEDVGVSAGAVPAIISQIQKSLGGFNEMGEPTKDVFAAIGLSVEELKALNAPQQIAAIGAALAKLPKEEAANLAAKIVSRGSAGDLLQIARSTEDFARALALAAPQAEIMARNAAAFDRIGDTMGEIKLKARGLFAGIAEGAAPGIQAVLNSINTIDLTGLGVKFGQALTVATQAFRENKLGELLTLSLNVAFEESVNHFARLLQAVFAAIPAMIQASESAWVSVASGASSLLAQISAGQVGERINHLDPSSQEFQDGLRQMQKILEQGDFAAQESARTRAEAFANVGEAIKAAMGEDTFDLIQGGSLAKLKALSDSLLANAPKLAEAAAGGGGIGNVLGALGKSGSKKGADVNALERIGLVNLGRNPGVDYQRRSAVANESAVKLLIRQIDLMQRNFDRATEERLA